jgi:hypothetical protein
MDGWMDGKVSQGCRVSRESVNKVSEQGDETNKDRVRGKWRMSHVKVYPQSKKRYEPERERYRKRTLLKEGKAHQPPNK